jgi:cytochrome c heme-lyase
MYLWAGKIFPSKFRQVTSSLFRARLTISSEPPFDRHDWIVTRPTPAPSASPEQAPAEKTTTRYVIDYYSGPDDEEGNPVFVLDVRPALDDFASLAQRVKMGWEDWRTGEGENQQPAS